MKTQHSGMVETLECTREHAHSKVLIEPTCLDLCLRKTRADNSRDYRDVLAFEKLRFQNVFRPHQNAELRFQERFRKASFSVDNFSALVWTEGLTREIKLLVQIPPA